MTFPFARHNVGAAKRLTLEWVPANLKSKSWKLARSLCDSAAWVGFAGDKEARFVIVVVIFISAMFLGLLAGGGWYSRNMTAKRRSTRALGDFLNGVVEIETGKISGREALVQIAVGPVLLAIGGTLMIMCAAWAGVGG